MLLIGIPGTSVDADTRRWLRDPAVSGVILFTRNFASRAQVAALADALRETCERPLLIAVDQEGGPVQRFRDGFTRLPALARIGERHAQDPAGAIALAEEHAWLMASEMRAIGVDLSFAPVADLRCGNRAIMDRAFDAAPEVVSALVLAYQRGMHLAGMAATIKHFPGHGTIAEDTHFEHAVDARSLDALMAQDLVPFRDAIDAGAEAVMMAHVVYPAVDALAAGYSRVWIEEILRGDLGFRGVVMGDDISMAAADGAGGIAARVHAHLAAGCDFVLACKPEVVDEALLAVAGRVPADVALVEALQGRVAPTWDALASDPQRARVISRLAPLVPGTPAGAIA
jgi:beta-N-acetylhexosaminidase